MTYPAKKIQEQVADELRLHLLRQAIGDQEVVRTPEGTGTGSLRRSITSLMAPAQSSKKALL